VDFLNVGPWELIVVLIIAILVVGPERMVEIARKLGQYSRQLRQLSNEFLATLQAEVDLTEQGVTKAVDDVKKDALSEVSAVVAKPSEEE